MGPESENIHQDLTMLGQAAKQEIEALQGEVEKIRDEVQEMVKNMAALKKLYQNKEDNEDKFVSFMDEFIGDATGISNDLLSSFHESVKNIIDLAISFGEKKSISVEDFFKIWMDFLASWGKARQAVKKRKAEQKKKEKLLEKKAKLKAKLEKQRKKKDLKKKGIIKSKQDVKDHKRR